MKNALWFVVGLAGGFVAAHLVNKDPRGHELLAEVDARISEFTDRIADAYHEQEAQIAGLVESAKVAAGDAAGRAADIASDVTDRTVAAASDAASALADAASDAAAAAGDSVKGAAKNVADKLSD
ncbi:ATPase [Microbacterium sp. W1N]|uniref:ATPase n=1 Tax=Microbacterium festucae TaxID=2977531 RepID=UPI0021BE1B05|nr:ATPase [Microbacterium festucae]MCT9820114.1 ATPase [Microbacterium festucae]